MKDYTTTSFDYYEIKSPDGHYGLEGKFKTRHLALSWINTSYAYAKSNGYDNRRQRWNIVIVHSTRTYTNEGEFYDESTRCSISARTRFDPKTEQYIIVKD